MSKSTLVGGISSLKQHKWMRLKQNFVSPFSIEINTKNIVSFLVLIYYSRHYFSYETWLCSDFSLLVTSSNSWSIMWRSESWRDTVDGRFKGIVGGSSRAAKVIGGFNLSLGRWLDFDMRKVETSTVKRGGNKLTLLDVKGQNDKGVPSWQASGQSKIDNPRFSCTNVSNTSVISFSHLLNCKK